MVDQQTNTSKNKEAFESAERFWSGKPSLENVEKLVARMKGREAVREIHIQAPIQKVNLT